MATLTAWKFDTPEGAAEAENILVGLSKEQLINIYDAATVEWQPGKKKPKTRQANSLVAVGALGGAFWGLLFGILFFVPLLGIAIGAASGALGGSLGDRYGRQRVFIVGDAVQDRVKEAFAGVHAELIHTNLSNEDEAKLRAAFSDED